MNRIQLFVAATFIVTTLFVGAGYAWNWEDDDKLVQMVAAAATDEETGKFHRVTETTFKMAAPAAELCRIPLHTDKHNPHKNYFCHVFVNELALEPIKSGKGTYPVGSLIIKQKFSDYRGINTELFTVMKKMEKGYDDENGNWEYSIVDETAQVVLSRGKTDSCINCHTEYENTDYVTRLYMNLDGK